MGETITMSASIMGKWHEVRARMSLTLPQQTAEGPVLVALVEGQSIDQDKLKWTLSQRILLDTSTYLPKKIEFNVVGGRSRRLKLTRTSTGYKVQSDREPESKLQYSNQPPDIRDPVSMYLLLRALPLRPGAHIEAFLAGDLNQGPAWVPVIYQLKIDVGAEEIAGTPALSLQAQAFRWDPKSKAVNSKISYQGTLWLTNDAYRRPIKFELASPIGPIRGVVNTYEAALQPLPPFNRKAQFPIFTLR